MHQQCGVLISVEQQTLYPYVVKVEGVDGFLDGAICHLNEHEVEIMGDFDDGSPSDEAGR